MQKFEHLVVCGDSYQTPSSDPKFYGTHWSEILAERRGLKLITLASPGMSDTAIGFQILEAAKYTNAVVVISMCPGVRIDRAVQNYGEMRITHYTDFQSEHLGRKNKYIQVTPILSLNIDNPDDRVLLTSMNFDLEEFKQLSTIFYAMFLLQKKHDNFLFFDYMPFKHNKNTVDIIDQKNIITRQQLDLTENYINHSSTPNWSDIDPGYHTLPERQIQIADYLENRVWCGIL